MFSNGYAQLSSPIVSNATRPVPFPGNMIVDPPVILIVFNPVLM